MADVGDPRSTAAHQRLRDQVLAEEPWCKGWPRGVHRGERVRTTVLDHKRGLILGGTYARGNLGGLCGACSSRKSIEREGATGGPGGWRQGR